MKCPRVPGGGWGAGCNCYLGNAQKPARFGGASLITFCHIDGDPAQTMVCGKTFLYAALSLATDMADPQIQRNSLYLKVFSFYTCEKLVYVAVVILAMDILLNKLRYCAEDHKDNFCLRRVILGVEFFGITCDQNCN